MIYVVEDDDSIRNLVEYTLNASSLPAVGFSCPAAFWDAAAKEKPDLVLLDWMLPGEDGLQVLQKLRKRSDTAQIPVIMLTAKDSEYDKVVGLNAGADDYIPKPFGMMELVARINALLRRAKINRESILQFFELAVYPDLRRVAVEGKDVLLTPKEYELLEYLLRNKQRVLTREQLLSAVWGYDFEAETRTLDVHIRFLRQKLGVAGQYIRTVRSVGYELAAVPKQE